jgi:RNA polymerase sigma factor (sigma-70 family)
MDEHDPTKSEDMVEGVPADDQPDGTKPMPETLSEPAQTPRSETNGSPQQPETSDPMLDRALAGDQDALGQILEQERSNLTRRARRQLNGAVGRAVGASDFIQTCFRSAVRAFPSFRGRSRHSFHAWLMGIFTRKGLEKYRFLHRGKRDPDQVGPLAFDPWIDHRLPGKLPASEGSTRELGDAEWLTIAISQLKPADQALINMKYYDEMTFDEIADSLVANPATLRKQAARLMKKLAVGIPLLKLMHQRRYPTLHHDAICLWYFQSLTENDVVARLRISRHLFRGLIRELKPDTRSLMQQPVKTTKRGRQAAPVLGSSAEPD